MTQHDNLLQEVARLTRRQDQLERQQDQLARETSTRIDSLKRDVDRQRESARREMEQQFRDRDWRLRSLEQSRDNSQNLWIYLPLVVAIVFFIIVVTAAIASREQRQDAGEPEQRSPSSFHAPPLGAGLADDVDAGRTAPRATIVGL